MEEYFLLVGDMEEEHHSQQWVTGRPVLRIMFVQVVYNEMHA